MSITYDHLTLRYLGACPIHEMVEKLFDNFLSPLFDIDHGKVLLHPQQGTGMHRSDTSPGVFTRYIFELTELNT